MSKNPYDLRKNPKPSEKAQKQTHRSMTETIDDEEHFEGCEFTDILDESMEVTDLREKPEDKEEDDVSETMSLNGREEETGNNVELKEDVQTEPQVNQSEITEPLTVSPTIDTSSHNTSTPVSLNEIAQLIHSLETKLTDNQKQLETKLTENQKSLEKKLSTTMLTLEKKIDSTIGTLREEMNTLKTGYSKLQEDITDRFEDTNTKFTNLVTQTSEKIMQTVDTRIIGVENTTKQTLSSFQEKIEQMTKDQINKTQEQALTVQQSFMADTQNKLDKFDRTVMMQDEKLTTLEQRLDVKPKSEYQNINVTCLGNTGCLPEQTLPHFNGRAHNPKLFLERLKKFYGRSKARSTQSHNGNEFDHLFELLENCLEHHALRWWQMIKNDVQNWEDFEKAFEAKYWSRDVQRGVKQRLEIEKFRPSGALSRAEYFTERVVTLRSITPCPSDDEIINILVEHFDDVIKNSTRVQNIRTILDFEAMLQREDMAERNLNIRSQNTNNTLQRPQNQRYPENRRPQNPHQYNDRNTSRPPQNHYQRSPFMPQNPHAYSKNQQIPSRHNAPNTHPYSRSYKSSYQSPPLNTQDSYPTHEQQQLCHMISESSNRQSNSTPPVTQSVPQCTSPDNQHLNYKALNPQL